jgi:hypothetical protein
MAIYAAFFVFRRVAASVPTEVLGVGNWGQLLEGGKKKRKSRVLRWSDYADAEERQAALAKALAEAAVPLAALRLPDASLDAEAVDAEIEEEDALITALVMSRLIH